MHEEDAGLRTHYKQFWKDQLWEEKKEEEEEEDTTIMRSSRYNTLSPTQSFFFFHLWNKNAVTPYEDAPVSVQ